MNGFTFGTYIAAKRREAGLTLRETASHLGITAAYLCDVEKGNRSAFDLKRLHTFALMTGLNETEKEFLYDLAGENRGDISPDIREYLSYNTYIYAALRRVRTLNANEEDWKTMLEELERKKGV